MLLITLGGCSLLYEKGSETPTSEIKILSTGEKTEYNFILNVYTVWYKNGKMMFRATGWNGSNGFPMRWAPTKNNALVVNTFTIDKRILVTDRGYIFDYGLKDGKKIQWGAWDKYEGWFEDGKEKYVYSYRTRKVIEWDNTGKIIKEVNQSE